MVTRIGACGVGVAAAATAVTAAAASADCPAVHHAENLASPAVVLATVVAAAVVPTATAPAVLSDEGVATWLPRCQAAAFTRRLKLPRGGLVVVVALLLLFLLRFPTPPSPPSPLDSSCDVGCGRRRWVARACCCGCRRCCCGVAARC